jgi:integrase
MGRRSEHLQLRGSVYWLRVRVPDELRPLLGEIRRSLRTSDALEAKRRVRIERIKVEAEFDEARIRSDEDGLKRVKTTAGHRFMPVHPELKRIGFLEHVAAVRRSSPAGARLFPELPVARTGYISDNFSKWFARFLDHLGIDDRRKGFHSFRHTFRDALREAEIPQDRVRELGGRSSGSTEDDYGSGTRPSTLAREIAKIRYEGLDLRGLYPRERGRSALATSFLQHLEDGHSNGEVAVRKAPREFTQLRFAPLPLRAD